MDNTPLDDVARLLGAASTAETGWSRAYGGPEGVAAEAERLRVEALRAAADLMAIRTAAIAQLLEEESLRTVEKRVGIGRSALNKADRAWRDGLAFRHLRTEESW